MLEKDKRFLGLAKAGRGDILTPPKMVVSLSSVDGEAAPNLNHGGTDNTEKSIKNSVNSVSPW